MRGRIATAVVGAIAAVLLAALGGCMALPTIVPDMAWPSKPVRVNGGRGPLSVEQSKAVLESLKTRPGETSILDRHLAIEEAIVGSPLVAGNKAVLLQDGPRTYAAMLAAFRAARHHINFETCIIEEDEIGRRFADLLITKRRESVQVNLLFDSVGTIKTPREFFERLAATGVKIEYNPVNPLRASAGWDVNQRDHRKLLVIDGRIAFLGGINISSVYSGSSLSRASMSGSSRAARDPNKPAGGLPWRDTHLQVEGPVVADFQKLFVETWRKQKGPELDTATFFPTLGRRGKDVVRAIASSPDEPYSVIHATLISAIRNAEREVFLANAYFVPDPQLLDALKQAASRGVNVRLLLPSKTDSKLVFHAGRAYYSEVLAAGVRIWERHDAMLHSKTALVDGVWSTVGSTNLDWRSFVHNDELNAVVLGSDFGNQMRAMFEVDLEGSQEITLDAWKRRPVGIRLREMFARLWQYWL